MTQHLLPEHEEEDKRAMRRLGAVIGAFVVATIILATTVGVIMG